MIIADTGFWVALANRNDRHHARAMAWLERLDEPLVCTWPVVTETSYLLLRRVSSETQRQFLVLRREGLSRSSICSKTTWLGWFS